ncbi:hypothetical protein [Salinispira pacifica]|uniref:Uncharacterized protein n=1 Tax=Salinispira pacifica TaxID=1307761 RepID=V5WDT4_9SPIO|nr:hypothetical protein [Salinispira pacifica]AHC13968.1 hypothetical protein L21SP2_0536 [Salinispira pacifica]
MIHTIHFYDTPEPEHNADVIPVDDELLDTLLEDVSRTLDSILETTGSEISSTGFRSMPVEFIRFQGGKRKKHQLYNGEPA